MTVAHLLFHFFRKTFNDFFNNRAGTVEHVALLADREWLDGAKKTSGQFWKRKNARSNGVNLENTLA